MNAAIAQHLNIAESLIKSVEEWAHVLFVRFASGRPRFVSKKVIEMVVEVVKKASTWSGDELMMTSDSRIYIVRFSSYSGFGGQSVLAKDVTEQAKGKTVSQMMDWRFDTFHNLPLTNAPESVVSAAGW